MAGVKAGGYHRGWDYYRIRGFDASFTTFIERSSRGFRPRRRDVGLERVEVIEGPTSALYGQAVLGGIVNLQSKQPRPDTFADVQLTGGSFNYYDAAVDVGSSLNKSRTLYRRVNALYRPQKSFVDFAKSHRWYWACYYLGRHAGDHGNLALQAPTRPYYYGFPLPAKGTVIPNLNGALPIERYVGEPSISNDMDYKRRQLGYQFTHRFNEDFSLIKTRVLPHFHSDG